MTAIMKDVYSSTVSRIGWDPDTSELIVEFKSGTYAYSGVPANVAEEVSNAPSINSALNRQVKPYYGYRRMG